MGDAEELVSTLRDDPEALLRALREMQATPMPQAVWGTRWLEPESPWLLRLLLTGAGVCYALGFILDPMWFAACYGLVFMAWPVAEDRSKLKREARLAQHRSDMAAWEAEYRRVWRAAQIEREITPDWMC